MLTNLPFLVGAWKGGMERGWSICKEIGQGAEADTAACRFYITLCKAPQLNGNFTVFGKVTKGLDVVRTISLQPVRIEEQDTDGYHKPDRPVVIDKVTIQMGK